MLFFSLSPTFFTLLLSVHLIELMNIVLGLIIYIEIKILQD